MRLIGSRVEIVVEDIEMLPGGGVVLVGRPAGQAPSAHASVPASAPGTPASAPQPLRPPIRRHARPEAQEGQPGPATGHAPRPAAWQAPPPPVDGPVQALAEYYSTRLEYVDDIALEMTARKRMLLANAIAEIVEGFEGSQMFVRLSDPSSNFTELGNGPNPSWGTKDVSGADIKREVYGTFTLPPGVRVVEPRR